MAPKKQTAEKFFIRGSVDGEWSQGDSSKGVFRAVVNTDEAQLLLYAGPDYLEEWNPLQLESSTMKYLRGGSHLRISFKTVPLQWTGELELNVFGGFAGRFQGPNGAGKITGSSIVEEERDHVHQIPKPTQALAAKLVKEPSSIAWTPPQCVTDGTVTLVGIGGPSKSGKTVLAAALAERMLTDGISVVLVSQSSCELCPGSYSCASVNVSMYENPSAVSWTELARAVDRACLQVAPDSTESHVGLRAVVIVEGSLIFWMPQLCKAFSRRLFLRASRSEILRRRQAADLLPEPFVEHIFWPMHLQYGQPQMLCEELRVPNEQDGFPAPEELVSDALSYLQATESSAGGYAQAAAPLAGVQL